MRIYILTRTSNRPKMFQRLQDSIAMQDFDGKVLHFVYSDDASDTYPSGEAVVRGERKRKSRSQTAPWETYNLELLEAVKGYGKPGFITFIDDDDVYSSESSLSIMARHSAPGVMPIWKVERENGRISPFEWRGDLDSQEGRICWEAAGFHTDQLDLALSIGIDGNDGGDGRFWSAMSKQLEVRWVDEVLTKPQVGKGHGRRKDE